MLTTCEKSNKVTGPLSKCDRPVNHNGPCMITSDELGKVSCYLVYQRVESDGTAITKVKCVFDSTTPKDFDDLFRVR